MAGRLEGKVAIVTGAAAGIGEAIAHKFAKEGAKVVVNGLPDDPVDDVVSAITQHGGQAVGCKADVSEEIGAQQCVETAVKQWGGLDILINNAGVFLVSAETQDYPIDLFDKTNWMNIRSVFLMTKYALPHLQKSNGVIVSAGSEGGLMGEPYNTVYGGTKGWIHAFMRGVAVEQANHGVRANCVCPGPVDTAWTHKSMSPMDTEMEMTFLGATPMGRRGTVEEIANVYAFLASDEASYVTGALWSVDGGITTSKGMVGMKADKDLRQEPPVDLDLQHTYDGLKNKDTREIK